MNNKELHDELFRYVNRMVSLEVGEDMMLNGEYVLMPIGFKGEDAFAINLQLGVVMTYKQLTENDWFLKSVIEHISKILAQGVYTQGGK